MCNCNAAIKSTHTHTHTHTSQVLPQTFNLSFPNGHFHSLSNRDAGQRLEDDEMRCGATLSSLPTVRPPPPQDYWGINQPCPELRGSRPLRPWEAVSRKSGQGMNFRPLRRSLTSPLTCSHTKRACRVQHAGAMPHLFLLRCSPPVMVKPQIGSD